MPIPRVPPVTRTGRLSGVNRRGGSGSYAGAELGSSSHPAASWVPLALFRFRGRVAEAIQQVHLLGGIRLQGMALREVEDELFDPGAQLVCELRRRRPDERIDVFSGRLRAWPQA